MTEEHQQEEQPLRTGSGRPVPRIPVVVVSTMMTFITGLNIALVVIAMPTIRATLGLDSSTQQWLVSAFYLAIGLVLVPAGRFGDIHGRRNIFVTGMTAFVVASGAAAIASHEAWLIAARLVQGMGIGLALAQVFGTIQRIFTAQERGLPFGAVSAGINVARVVGPVLGGGLVAVGGAEWGWRWAFLVNVPVGIVIAILGWRFFPVAERAHRPRMDLVGAILLMVGLGVVWLTQGEQLPEWLTWTLLATGVVVLVGFVRWEKRYARRGVPMFDMRLFRFQSFWVGMIIAVFYTAGYDGIYYLMSEYLQHGLGHDELVTGVALTPLALGAAISSVIAGSKAGRLGRPLVVSGLLLAAVGLIALLVADLFLPGPDSPHAATLPLLLAGLGGGLVTSGVAGGLVIAPNLTIALSPVPRTEGGSAGGMLETGQAFGGGLGVGLVGTVLFASLDRTGDWLTAFRIPVLVIVGLFAIALTAALLNLFSPDRSAPPG
nr:MFS transporter [Salinispora fenicalii]